MNSEARASVGTVEAIAPAPEDEAVEPVEMVVEVATVGKMRQARCGVKAMMAKGAEARAAVVECGTAHPKTKD